MWCGFEGVADVVAVGARIRPASLRMADRDFDEIDLRTMLENASGFSPNIVPGRFTVHTRHSGQPWEVIVEPDDVDELLVVITAYRAG